MDDVIGSVLVTGFFATVPLALLTLFLIDTRSEVARLRRRLNDLERARSVAPPASPSAPEAAPAASPSAPTAPAASPAAPGPKPAPKPPARPRPARPPLALPSPERLVVWFAAAAGGAMALLAALFALVAVVEAGWVGPALRVSAGFAGGAALWVAGAVGVRRSWRWTGSALQGVGIGTLYGAAYAGSGLYRLFPTEVAGPIMGAVTVVGTARAWRHDDRFVALLSLFGGLLTPILLSTGDNKPYSLWLYLVLLSAGMLAAAAKRGWPEVVGATGLGVGALYAGWTAQWYVADQTPAGLAGALALSAPFWLTATAPSLPVRAVAQAVVVGLALAALPWLAPVDGTFLDPRSGLSVARGPVLGAVPVALAATALGVAPFLAARRAGSGWDGLHALPGALLLPLVTAGGIAWSDGGSAGVLLAASGTALGAVLATARHAPSALAAAPLAAGAGLALAIGSHALSPRAGVAPALLVAVVSRGLQGSSGSGLPALSGLLGIAAISLAATSLEGAALRAAAGGLVLVFATEGLLAARARRPSAPEAAWVAAAGAGIAVFPGLYAAWQDGLGDELVGALPLILGAGTLLATGSLARRQRLASDHWLVSVFVLVVALAVTVALPLQLETRWLTVGLSLEAALLARVAERIRLHGLVRVVSIGLAFVVAARLLLNPYALAWGTAADGWPLLNWTLYSWGVPALALLGVARWSTPRAPYDLVGLFRLPVLVLSILVGFALVNVEIAHAFRDAGPLELSLFGGNRLESMVRSASWAGYGLAILGAGLWADQRVVRLIGFSFVLLATGKVFLVDLWDLAGFVRVGSLFCLAISLLLAAFAFERLVLRSSRAPVPTPSDESTP